MPGIIFDEKILDQILNFKGDIGIPIDLDWEKHYEGRTEHPKSEADNVILKDLDDHTSVKIHRIQHIESIDMMFDMLETTKTWGQEIDSNLFDIIPNGNLL